MIKYAFYNTNLFTLSVGYDRYDNKEVVVSLSVKNEADAGIKNEPCGLSDLAAEEINEYLSGRRREFTFPYELRGTEFQLAVWRQLLKIPYGQTRSYGEIAAAVGKPRAARAVGMANNKNPLFIVVPCHRVIGADSSLVGYGGGLDLKARLLEIERNSTEIHTENSRSAEN